MPEPDYNTYAVSSAPTSSPSPKSRPSGLGSRKMDADMYAGSSYATTSGAGTSSAKQKSSAKATSTGSSAAAATANDDDGPGYGQLYSNTAMALTAAGATLKAPTQAVYNPMNLYSSQSMQEISTEINDYLRNTAVDDALREALNIPEVYQGAQTQEEPDPNITDPDVLRDALQPEPITVEELPDVIVKAGDTLTAIAEANGVPVQDVIDANPHIKNPDLIRPGEIVSMPAAQAEMGLGRASIMSAQQDIGQARASLIMKGIDKLFGLFPPKTDIEKKAKSELEYFLDAQPESSLPDFFKYVPDKVQLAEYMKGRAERKKAAGAMNFSDRSALTNMDNLQFVDIEPEMDDAGLMTRPKARPEGLRALSEPEKNKAAQKYLGITADGIWGKGSTRKLAGWQYQNGVPVSGVLDEATIKAMENPETEDPRKEITRKSVLNTAGTAPDISKVKDWAKENIKDPMRAAAFVATVEAETGNRALVESGHTVRSAVRTFVTNNKYMHEGDDVTRPLTAKGKRRKQKLEALGSNATGDEIFDFIYGPDTDAIGGRLGNTSATDGSKYKGRGLVQITGKDNYQRVGNIIGVDLVNNPELVKDPKYAAAAAMAYLTLPGKDFFDGTLTSDKLASAIGHTGSAAARWTAAEALKNEMYP